MIHALPREIVEHILYYLLARGYEATGASGNPTSGYVNLGTWNEMQNYSDVMALADTCTSLKYIVYSVIFKAWACHTEEKSNTFLLSMNNKLKSGTTKVWINHWPVRRYSGYFLPKLPEKNNSRYYFYTEYFSSLLNPKCKPTFYIVAGYPEMIYDALQHVQHLNLSFDITAVPHSKQLSKVLPKMKALKEVTLWLVLIHRQYGIDSKRTCVHFKKDSAFVIDQIKSHSTTLTVHTYLRLHFECEESLRKFLTKFQRDWRHWKDLTIETLQIEVEDFEYSFPRKFCKMLGKLRHLKRFSINYLGMWDHSQSTFYTSSSVQIVEWLRKLPKLEDISLCCRCFKPAYFRGIKSEVASLLEKVKKNAPPSNFYKLSYRVSSSEIWHCTAILILSPFWKFWTLNALAPCL